MSETSSIGYSPGPSSTTRETPQARDAESLALVERIRSNPGEAFPHLVERFGGLIWYIIRKVGKTPEDCQDMYQEVLLALLENNCRRITQWKPTARFSSYLYVVVWRICLKHQQKIDRNNLTVTTPSTIEQSTKEPTQRFSVALSELIDQIGDCFGSMIKSGIARRADRPMFLLRAEGHPARLVGEYLGMAENVVHLRFKRVRDRLRDCLNDHGFSSDADLLMSFDPSEDFVPWKQESWEEA